MGGFDTNDELFAAALASKVSPIGTLQHGFGTESASSRSSASRGAKPDWVKARSPTKRRRRAGLCVGCAQPAACTDGREGRARNHLRRQARLSFEAAKSGHVSAAARD